MIPNRRRCARGCTLGWRAGAPRPRPGWGRLATPPPPPRHTATKASVPAQPPPLPRAPPLQPRAHRATPCARRETPSPLQLFHPLQSALRRPPTHGRRHRDGHGVQGMQPLQRDGCRGAAPEGQLCLKEERGSRQPRLRGAVPRVMQAHRGYRAEPVVPQSTVEGARGGVDARLQKAQSVLRTAARRTPDAAASPLARRVLPPAVHHPLLHSVERPCPRARCMTPSHGGATAARRRDAA